MASDQSVNDALSAVDPAMATLFGALIRSSKVLEERVVAVDDRVSRVEREQKKHGEPFTVAD